MPSPSPAIADMRQADAGAPVALREAVGDDDADGGFGARGASTRRLGDARDGQCPRPRRAWRVSSSRCGSGRSWAARSSSGMSLRQLVAGRRCRHRGRAGRASPCAAHSRRGGGWPPLVSTLPEIEAEDLPTKTFSEMSRASACSTFSILPSRMEISVERPSAATAWTASAPSFRAWATASPARRKEIVDHVRSESSRKPRVMMSPNMRLDRKSSRHLAPLSGWKRASCQAACIAAAAMPTCAMMLPPASHTAASMRARARAKNRASHQIDWSPNLSAVDLTPISASSSLSWWA